MWPGVFALLGIVLLILAAVGVNAGRVSLALLGAAALAAAVTWPQLSAIGG
jgi:hypothetical protein